jgi:ABC-type sugar transport system substrate-binding protein
MRARVATTLSLAALAAVGGCGERKPARAASTAGGASVCFAFQDLETEFWVAGHEAIGNTLRQQGLRVIERNASEDANRQLEQVRDCIAEGVAAIVLIPQDGESANTIVKAANRAGVPVGVFNRPTSDTTLPAVVVVADNRRIARETVEFLASEAAKLGRPVVPLVMVGDLGDRNAVARRQGFFDALAEHPGRFATPLEVPTKWDAATAHANLEAAMRANPNVDLIFASSDFMLPQIRAVLEPLGKWKPAGQTGHVILGGLDGDRTACELIRAGYVDATGVQDLYFEANAVTSAILAAVRHGTAKPDTTIEDHGFALTRANVAQRGPDAWGCTLLDRAKGK